MEARGWMFFNVLVNRFHQKDSSTFLSQLPKETLEALKQHPASSSDTATALRLPEQTLPRIHFSWLVPVLSQNPESLRALLITCTPPSQQQGLCRQFKLPLPKKRLSKPAKAYLLRHLARQVDTTQALPLAYLPESPLTPLASLSKEKLILLIDYLGLRDLAEALRPIVDNRLLQAIHRCLKPPELQLLRAYLHQRDTLKVPKLDFSKWDGQRDSLRLLYHQRGLTRLAKSLSGQSPDLLWHISRHLDQKRANLLENLRASKDAPVITQTLVLQVVAILEFLQRQHGE